MENEKRLSLIKASQVAMEWAIEMVQKYAIVGVEIRLFHPDPLPHQENKTTIQHGRIGIVLAFVLLASTLVHAQTKTIVDLRMGMRDRATYHLAEVFQVRGRWVAPDVGYIDFGSSDYREWFAGGGYKLFVSNKFTLIGELYLAQAADKATYLQPWLGAFYTLTPRLGGEAAMFPYLPLSGAGNRQWVIERAKLEYALSHALKIGVGYGGYQFGGQPWQHKPFATATITPVHGKLGSLELWLQKLPHGKAQVQIRYELVHIGKKR